MKTVNENVQSILKMKNLYFESISFERDVELPNEFSTKFDTEFNTLSETEIEVKLKCNISSNNKFRLSLTLVGTFENFEKDEKIREEINRVNTISIMFPYLRSEVSLVTAQPNFPTIDLPIINIHALLEENGMLVGSRKD